MPTALAYHPAAWPAFIGAALTAAAQAQPALFATVPPLPGAATPYSIAYAATPDGKYVVGYSGSAPGPQAYRWDRTTGRTDALGFLGTADWFRSKAYAVSDDGAIVVGRSDMGDGSHPFPRAFLWSIQNGITALPYATTSHQLGPQGNAAVAISPDGATIIGRFESYATGSDGTPFYPALMHEWCRWTSGGTTAQLIGTGPTALAGLAESISGDGSVIAGYVGDTLQATVVTGGSPVLLGHLPSGHKAEPTAISRDGSTVVGWADAADPDGIVRFHAFRWRQATGMTDLGGLSGLSGPSRAAATSGDGSITVGSQQGNCLIWDTAHGVRDLSQVLTNQYGLDLQGKVLREATWISPDGTWVVGNADDASGPLVTAGWIAHIP